MRWVKLFSAAPSERMKCSAARVARGFVVALCTHAFSDLAAQEGALVGYVSGKTGERLAYSIVGVEGRARSQFSDDSGRFDFRGLPAGRQTVHVRRLGYLPRLVDVEVHTGGVDTLHVVLERVAVNLDGIEVKAYPPCTNPGAPTRDNDSTLASIVDQIRLNAEQYRFLAEQYPFAYTVNVTRSALVRATGVASPKAGSIEVYRSLTRHQYKPGEVIRRSGRTSYFMIPTLLDVADRSFVNAHCWHFAGVDTINDEPMVRIDVVAFDKLKGADVNGSFLVSRESFQIRRSILHLSRRPERLEELMDMEVKTDFIEVLQSIPIINYVYSVQTMDPEKKSLLSEAYEEHQTVKFTFLRRKPGDQGKP